jgi:predicted P-loop ATPase
MLLEHLARLPFWDQAARYNQMTCNYEVLTCFPPPAHPVMADPSGRMVPTSVDRVYRPLDEVPDVLNMLVYCQARQGLARTTKHIAWDALRTIAQHNPYHPVREYFSKLAWDGTERVNRLFLDYFNAELPSDHDAQARLVLYLADTARCFMVGAVARVMDPGCKVDHVPVLIGKQGILKSTAIAALCHDEAWFTDNISPNLIERDTKESLRGKWIIELAEMPHINREVEKVKVFISTRADRYRAAYGMANLDYPRQCVFIGTTNNLELIDSTGNRRFWPFKVADNINIDRLVADRDQLWAEAMHLHRSGSQWWLPPKIEAFAAEQQAEFVQSDPWDDWIDEWLISRGNGAFTLRELIAFMTDHRRIEEADWTKAEEMRLAGRLRIKGWDRYVAKVGSRSIREWRKS